MDTPDKNCLLGYDSRGNTILIPLFLHCTTCEGTGKNKDETECPDCQGEGRTPFERNTELLDAWFGARYNKVLEEAAAELEGAAEAAEDLLEWADGKLEAENPDSE